MKKSVYHVGASYIFISQCMVQKV